MARNRQPLHHHLRRDRRRLRQARRRRLLGRVVRAVQEHRPDPRARSPTELGDQVTIAKVNVDDNPDLAMRYNVMSIPTLLVFDGGEVHKRLVGAKGKVPTAPGARRIPRFLPLTPGQHGDAIRDLQRRLGAAGFPPGRRRGGSVLRVDRGRRAGVPAPPRPARPRTLRRADVAGAGRGVVALGDRRCGWSRRTCAATTSASCRPRSAASASTAAGSTASSARPRPAPSRTSSATAGSTSTACAARPRSRALEINGARTGTGPGVADDPRARAARAPSARRCASCASSSASSAGSARSPATVAQALRQHGATGHRRRRARPVAPGRGRQPLRRRRLHRLRGRGRRPRRRSPTTPPPGSSRPAAGRWPSASPTRFDADRRAAAAAHRRDAPAGAARDPDDRRRVLARTGAARRRRRPGRSATPSSTALAAWAASPTADARRRSPALSDRSHGRRPVDQ